MNYQTIGKEKAIKLYESEWWKNQSAEEIAKFQLFTDELCCPFKIFHEAIEKALGRPVFTHELGLNRDGIALELIGEADAPTMQEILDLIPAGKQIVVLL